MTAKYHTIGTVSTVTVTHAERIGPGTKKPAAMAAITNAALNATPGTVGSSLATSTMKATIAMTTHAPAAAPSTCAKPGGGRRSARHPKRGAFERSTASGVSLMLSPS